MVSSVKLLVTKDAGTAAKVTQIKRAGRGKGLCPNL